MNDHQPKSDPTTPAQSNTPMAKSRAEPDQTSRQGILKLPMGPVVWFFALGLAAIVIFVLLRYVFPGPQNY